MCAQQQIIFPTFFFKNKFPFLCVKKIKRKYFLKKLRIQKGLTTATTTIKIVFFFFSNLKHTATSGVMNCFTIALRHWQQQRRSDRYHSNNALKCKQINPAIES